ncbi:Hypothetical protein I5071_1900 [Sandaracinus amylolyticus]|nr:Hypothetical protein I5071_1900 [Sandaracinus amylolyticus]
MHTRVHMTLRWASLAGCAFLVSCGGPSDAPEPWWEGHRSEARGLERVEVVVVLDAPPGSSAREIGERAVLENLAYLLGQRDDGTARPRAGTLRARFVGSAASCGGALEGVERCGASGDQPVLSREYWSPDRDDAALLETAGCLLREARSACDAPESLDVLDDVLESTETAPIGVLVITERDDASRTSGHELAARLERPGGLGVIGIDVSSAPRWAAARDEVDLRSDAWVDAECEPSDACRLRSFADLLIYEYAWMPALAVDSSGHVACRLLERVPSGRSCAALSHLGRSATAEADRCAVRQDHASGWYYVQELRELRFARGHEPVTGSEIVVECAPDARACGGHDECGGARPHCDAMRGECVEDCGPVSARCAIDQTCDDARGLCVPE